MKCLNIQLFSKGSFSLEFKPTVELVDVMLSWWAHFDGEEADKTSCGLQSTSKKLSLEDLEAALVSRHKNIVQF